MKTSKTLNKIYELLFPCMLKSHEVPKHVYEEIKMYGTKRTLFFKKIGLHYVIRANFAIYT